MAEQSNVGTLQNEMDVWFDKTPNSRNVAANLITPIAGTGITILSMFN